MSERRPETRLPDDPSYWERLAARSIGAAFGTTAAPGGGTAAPVGGTAAPIGETATPVGETAAPIGETATPVGETATPVEAMAAPIEAMAEPIEAHGAHAHDAVSAHPWWRGISDSAFMLAASAVLALLGGSVLIEARSPREITAAHAMLESPAMYANADTSSRAPGEPGALAAVLAPDSPMLVSLLDEPAGPPSGSALLKLIALRVEER